MEFELRPTTKTEEMYTYSQSQQLRMQTGCIGYLRTDMDTNGKGFFSSWNGFRDELKTLEFRKEIDELIAELRKKGNLLHNRTTLAKHCYSQAASSFDDDSNFGVRVDTKSYSYMMRLNPNKGEYNLYCYCYRRDLLDSHMQQAERGIRFIDPHYSEKFRIQDGGSVRLLYSDSTQKDATCRYIDNYHLELDGHLYHICEFAELVERGGSTVEPLEGLIQSPEKKAQSRGEAR